MKQRKRTILSDEEVLVSLVNIIPAYLYWKDAQGIYQGCTRSHALRLGLKKGSEAIGKTDQQLLAHDAQQQFSHDDELVLSEGKTKIIEERVQQCKRTVILLSLKSPILRKRKQVVGMLSFSLDITHERQLKETVRVFTETRQAF